MNANVASSTATAMSAAATMPTPPARAGPASLATTGFELVQIWVRISGNSLTPSVAEPAVPASLRSMPAQNTGPVWSRTITRTASSPAAVARWSRSSRRSCADSALRLCGESSVIVATPLSVE